ncbi:putative glycosyltransferase [Ilyonectria sp. MPI-CAGE-AT-0026]|nr:putative glycosyltransferase [Ilyonectria sp. MPI-CAGE-AT-0026]
MSNITPIQTAGMPVFQRRLLVVVLNVSTILSTLWTLFAMFKPGGITFLEGFILFCATICTPPYIVKSWNYIIGVCINAFGNAEESIYPYFDANGPLPEITSNTALTICMRNEDPTPVFTRLHAMRESLRQTGRLQHFRFVMVSDTSRPDAMQMEDEGFARLRNSLGKGMSQAAVYRRRDKNTGFKAGNIKDYLDNYSKGDDFFVVLDSDSAMSGDLLVRMVSSMEKYPHMGLLQTQLTGMPAVGTFARLFQFGPRYRQHMYNLGSSWWVNDCAFYWGHNAMIRTKAFHENCMLPILPGKPPLGGCILSHDVMEGIFLRRAGYEVRMIPIETESYETNPPTFLDHLRREQRWCQGSMQYWFMLKEPGLKPVSRFQVYYILVEYLAPACWALLSFAGVAKGLLGGFDDTEVDFRSCPQLIIIGVYLLPQIAGIIDIAGTSFERYGGGFRCIVSALLELILMTLIGPTTAVATTVFLCGLFMGKSITWDGQNRDRLGLSWRETFRVLWPQTLIGFGIAGLLIIKDTIPQMWALLFVTSLCLATPFAVLTASPRLGHITIRLRLFTIPEEVKLPPLLSLLMAPETISATKALAVEKTCN